LLYLSQTTGISLHTHLGIALAMRRKILIKAAQVSLLVNLLIMAGLHFSSPLKAQDEAEVQSFGQANTDVVTDAAAEQFKIFEAQEKNIDQNVGAKLIDLRTVLATGLNRNIDQQVREFNREKLDLTWEDDFSRFWFPQVKFNLRTEDQRVQSFRKSNTSLSQTPNVPAGSAGIEFGDYSVFNWGRDYLEYLNNKDTYNRNKLRLSEERRQLKFNLIAQYFNVVRAKKILDYRRQQLRQTSFVHRLARQKLTAGRLSANEYHQTRAEYLRAYSLFQEAQFDSIEQDQALADLVGEKMISAYRPSEELKFVGINTSINESLNLALNQSPTYRDAKLDFENANRSYKKALKENMPLPEIKLRLGAYENEFSRNGSTTQFSAAETSRDVELVASLNLTWTIWGDGGFFNSRVIQRSYLDKRISEVRLINAKRELEVRIHALYRKIRFLERRSEGSDLQMKNAQTAFDSTLDSYISGKAPFPNFKIALDVLIESQVNYENAKFEHLIKKLELADSMGLEDFPGSNFENLAERVVR